MTSVTALGLELGIEVEDVDGMLVEDFSSACAVTSVTALGLGLEVGVKDVGGLTAEGLTVSSISTT